MPKFASVGGLSEGAIASSLVIVRPNEAILVRYLHILDEPYRWETWAAPKGKDGQLDLRPRHNEIFPPFVFIILDRTKGESYYINIPWRRRIKNARFPVLKTLDQFSWSWPKKINRMAVQNLFRLQFMEDHSNVIMLGTVGLGKTHIATALGYTACLAGKTVLFATAVLGGSK